MSQLYVDNIKGRTGGAIGAPSGVNATGVVTGQLSKAHLVNLLEMFLLVAH